MILAQIKEDDLITSVNAREKIIEAAERLFADRGIASVTLNEINSAAEQRNTAAVHYHFKNKAGLVEVVLARHMEPLDGERRARLDALELAGDTRLVSLVRTLVEPLAERLGTQSGCAFLRIQAQISPEARHATPAGRRLAALVGRGLDLSLPTQLARMRGEAAQLLLFPALAERARHEAATPTDTLHRALFVENLVDVLLGMLEAPVSEAAHALVREAALGA
jgi:AcrR family transcriptional regulator